MSDYKYGSYELRPYQAEAYEAIGWHIRNLSRFKDEKKDALIGSFIEASVGAGKTAIMGAVASRLVSMGWPILCLARDLKLVEQNSETFWDMRLKNSIYSASYSKSMHYKDLGVIVSNEATASRALNGKGWSEYAPRAILIDECLVGSSMIETDDGLSRIDDPDLKNKNIKCINEINGRVSFDMPVRVFSNGIKHVSHIYLSNGDKITCTDTHKIYSNGSWVRAKYLKSGSMITLNASGDSFTKKLLRAVAAVVVELKSTLTKLAWLMLPSHFQRVIKYTMQNT